GRVEVIGEQIDLPSLVPLEGDRLAVGAPGGRELVVDPRDADDALEVAAHGVVNEERPLVLPPSEEGHLVSFGRPGQVLLAVEGAIHRVLELVGESLREVAEDLAILGGDYD